MVVAACGGGNSASSDGGGDGGSGSNVDDGGTPIADADPSCHTGQLPAMKAQLVAQSFTQPLYIAQPAGSTDVYVVEKQGKIKIVRNPDVATATPVQTLIAYDEDGNNNVGGTVVFGADGYLYISTGDGSNAPEAQDLTSRRGKILRVDVDAPATAPPGNLTTSGADPFIWDYGLRNPFRMAFDRQTHELFIGDAGDALQEEVDIEPAGSGKHNYGWSIVEGNVCHDGTTTCDKTGTTLPQYTRPHQADYSALIGGSMYRGAALPCLKGTYIFAIYGTEAHILSWSWTGTAITNEKDLTNTFNVDPDVVSINEDASGELYLVTLGGNLYKIVPA